MALTTTETNTVVFAKSDLEQAIRDYMVKHDVESSILDFISVTFGTLSPWDDLASTDPVLTIVLPLGS